MARFRESGMAFPSLEVLELCERYAIDEDDLVIERADQDDFVSALA